MKDVAFMHQQAKLTMQMADNWKRNLHNKNQNLAPPPLSNKNKKKTKKDDKKELDEDEQDEEEEKQEIEISTQSQKLKELDPVQYYCDIHTKYQKIIKKSRTQLRTSLGDKFEDVVNPHWEFEDSEDFWLTGFTQTVGNKEKKTKQKRNTKKNESYKAGEIFIIYGEQIKSLVLVFFDLFGFFFHLFYSFLSFLILFDLFFICFILFYLFLNFFYLFHSFFIFF